MTAHLSDIDAVSFDFYNTLAYHRKGGGRGAMLMEYFRTQGLESDPWEHQVLYDVFEHHGRDYSPTMAAEDKRHYLISLTNRVFQRLDVRVPDGAAADHAANVWRVLGPASLGVFADVPGVFRLLRGAGYRLVVVSNWQCGLRHFCTELGFGEFLDHVVASAEVDCAKPNPEIFREACRRLAMPGHRVVHVGDSVVDDVAGAQGAGMPALLVQRDDAAPSATTPMITTLDHLPHVLGLTGEPGDHHHTGG